MNSVNCTGVTIHKVAVEDDYFTAVDDLNNGEEDSGSAHIGEAGFGAGVFYLYLCINRELLQKNLGDDEALTKQSLAALLNAVSKVSPTGKQNSFASRAYPVFVSRLFGGCWRLSMLSYSENRFVRVWVMPRHLVVDYC